MKIAIVGTAVALLIIIIIVISSLAKALTPSREVMQLSDYYKVSDTEVLIILQNEIYQQNGRLINDKVYIDLDTVKTYFNHRFYWDNNENTLTYTTPDEIIRAKSGSKKYSVIKNIISTDTDTDYPVVEVFADKVYISLDFVKQYSDLNYAFYTEPNRVVIEYIWGDYLYTEVSKETQLRTEPDIKSPILRILPVGTSLMLVNTEEAPKKGFIKVMTEDGIKGYVRQKHTKESVYKTVSSSYQAPVYSSQKRSKKINMAFHQIFNTDAADKLESLIAETKQLNVVSPTFFAVSDNEGNIKSIATEDYVTKAKSLGLEVWALVNDFDQNVNMYELLSHTSSRETLINNLIESALTYKLNGLNIDFEYITSDSGPHYIQFLRELSVKCRNNGIVLSVDNYIPAPYRKYYDMEEQGIIVDYIVLMAYDEYYAGSEVAGPVASIGFVKDAINNSLEMVPKDKLIVGIPFYTRLWKETAEGEVSSEALAMTPAWKLVSDNALSAEWNDTLGCYYVEYSKDNATYKMWLEDEKSIEEKMKLIYEADVAGVAAWKLGLERSSVWNIIERYLKK
ncbi:MAG: glycosyl hydrolase family 18 [Clostridiales bacterium]|nr:glycosyl hydrolase family 18 [Clostridiales bacterium]